MKIGHYSDIQVALNEFVSYNLKEQILKNIVTEFEKEQVDGIILAGDIFDVQNPKESERLLISNHFIDILKMEQLKFFGILLGNHDYLDVNKNKDVYTNTNPIDTLTKIIGSIDVEMRNKIVYLKEQKPYDVPHFDNIKLYPYSLEGGKSYGDNIINYVNELDPNKLNLTIHHDITYEYVEQEKLPLTQRKKDSLIRVNSNQFFTDIILGGDIHQHYIINGNENYPNRKYFYGGNIFERNFGEGSYAFVRKNLTLKPTYIRGVNIHTFEENSYVKTDFKTLPKLISYLTIDVNTNRRVENLSEQFTEVLDNHTFGENLNFIRFKMAQMYAPLENELRKFINQYLVINEDNLKDIDIDNINIEFIYDKQSSQLSNSIVENMKLNSIKNELDNGNISEAEFNVLKSIIIDGVDSETAINEGGIEVKSEIFSKILSENMSIDDIINDENVTDSLSNILLSKPKIIDLFRLQLNTHKASILKQVGTEESVNKIINEIQSRFEKEFNEYYVDTNQYQIELIEAEFNLFCRLGSNKIQLNNVGLTRINGSNGVGKTALYNYIYYMINGVIYKNLKQNEKVKNTSLIFNNFKPDEDVSDKFLRFKVNGKNITLNRKDTRIWKTSAIKNEELKSDVNAVKYIQTIEREIVLDIDGYKIYGDNVQPKLDEWFGDISDNTLIIDKFTIPQMLMRGGNNLSSLVMEYLAPYLNLLEQDLKNIKEQYNVVKPKKTLAEIFNEVTDIKFDIKAKNKEIETLNESINKSNVDIENNDLKRKNIREKLIKIGDVKNNIIETNNNITTTLNKLNETKDIVDNFVVKDVPTFDLVEPKKDSDKINYYTNEITKLDNLITEKQSELIELNNQYNVGKDEFNINYNKQKDELRTKFMDVNSTLINEINVVNDKLNKNLDVAISEENTLMNEVNIVYNKRINILENRVKEIEQLKDKLNNEYSSLNDNINNSFCPTCNREYDETDTTHIEASKKRISEIETEIIDVNSKITNSKNALNNYINDGINSLLNEDSHYNEIVTLASQKVAKCKSLLEHKLVVNLLIIREQLQKSIVTNDNIQIIETIINSKLLDENFLIKYEELIELIELGNELKKINYEDLDSTIENRKLINDVNDNITQNNNLRTLKTNIINDINNEFNVALQTFVEANKKYTDDVILVNNHNNSIHEKRVELENLNNKYDELTNILSNLKISEITFNELSENDNELIAQNLSHQTKIDGYNKEISLLLNDINSMDFELIRLDEMEQENIEYLHNSIIYKTYETMIKKSFKSDIFHYYKNFLNSTLNLLLEDNKFKLVWQDDGELYYNEVVDGKFINIPVIMVSGMQQIFLGLSLIFTLSLLNTRTNINTIFIDEISGSLNNGKGLKHTNNIIDYQNQLILLLFKFKNKSIYIIDHVIDNLFETESYEVILTDEGSKYIKNDEFI